MNIDYLLFRTSSKKKKKAIPKQIVTIPAAYGIYSIIFLFVTISSRLQNQVLRAPIDPQIRLHPFLPETTSILKK